MTRDERFKYVGAIFYLNLLSQLAVTQVGMQLLGSIQSQPAQATLLAPLIGLGVAFFTTGSVGFVFGTFCRGWWELRGWGGSGGYSWEWETKLSTNVREIVKESADGSQCDEETTWDEPVATDVLLSFFWQRGPKEIVEWVERRHTTHFLGWAVMLALVTSSVIATVIAVWKWGFTGGNAFMLLMATSLFSVLHVVSAWARKEACQMIDLWLQSRVGIQSARIQEMEARLIGTAR